jgi:hypothetical protein
LFQADVTTVFAKVASHTFRYQKGNPTQQITMRRVFQMFEGIDVLWIETGGPIQKFALNMNEIHQRIISYLGKELRKCYLLE